MNLDSRLLRALSAARQDVRAAFTLAVLLGLVSGLLLIAQAALLARVVDRVFLHAHTLHQVAPLLAALVLIAVGRAAALAVGEIAAHHVAGRIKTDLRSRLLRHIAALGPAYTRGERSGELANTAIQGVEELDAYFAQYLPQLALAALIPGAILLVVFPLDVLTGVVLLLTAPLIPFFMILIGSAASHQSRRQWGQLSRLSAHFLDVLQGLTTLKLFGRERDQIAIIRRVSDQFRDATLSVLRIAFISALALEMLATLSTAIVAVEIGLRVLHDTLAFESAFFLLILAPEYYLPLRTLGARFHAGTSGTAAAARIFDVLETPLPAGPASAAPPAPLPADWMRHPIMVDDVHYAYADRPALRGVSLRLEPGQHTALIGPSGSGKSTLADLLLGFLTPDSGRILVGDRDLRAIPPDLWRAGIAWVPQSPYLLAASVIDNIRLARPDAPLADVVRAAGRAHAAEFIDALPQGYDTLLGERGARLSGGQAQRIALARAFLKDAPLIILDEATAHLDPATESLILDALDDLLAGRTALIIAHRLRTVERAHQVIALDAGRVALSDMPGHLSQ